MDFQVQVPRDIDVKVKTVMRAGFGARYQRQLPGAQCERRHTDPQYRGIGNARTVNGPVKVSFRQNPREASDFQTVNGISSWRLSATCQRFSIQDVQRRDLQRLSGYGAAVQECRRSITAAK